MADPAVRQNSLTLERLERRLGVLGTELRDTRRDLLGLWKRSFGTETGTKQVDEPANPVVDEATAPAPADDEVEVEAGS